MDFQQSVFRGFLKSDHEQQGESSQIPDPLDRNQVATQRETTPENKKHRKPENGL